MKQCNIMARASHYRSTDSKLNDEPSKCCRATLAMLSGCVVVQDLKLKFYQLMIELDQHEGAYLQICKHYRAVVDTPSVREDKEKHNQVCLSVQLKIFTLGSRRRSLLQ